MFRILQGQSHVGSETCTIADREWYSINICWMKDIYMCPPASASSLKSATSKPCEGCIFPLSASDALWQHCPGAALLSKLPQSLRCSFTALLCVLWRNWGTTLSLQVSFPREPTSSGFLRSFFNLHFVTPFYALTDSGEAHGRYNFSSFLLLPPLLLACSLSQQLLSPVASLPWISNHANMYFGSQLPNTSLSWLDSSKYIKRFAIWSRSLKKEKISLICLMFLLTYFMWWYIEKLIVCIIS